MSTPATGIEWGQAATAARDGAPLTDVGAAERFAGVYGSRWRFDHRRGIWLPWTGHRWAPDTSGAVTRAALELIRTEQAAALQIRDVQRKEAVVRFWIGREHRSTLENLLAIARNLVPIADSGDQWDRDPWLLGCANGVVALRTGTLRDGQPADRITMQAALAFDPDAHCPRWERFLLEVFAGDRALVDFLWRSIGYALTGDVSEQVVFLLHGTGANGKSTLLQTLRAVLGDYALNMPFSTLELHQRASIPNDLAALVGRRFVMASETNEGARLNEARIKALTGGDPITARFLHGEFFTFTPCAHFWLAVNHLPTVRDTSYGFWRRVLLVPFTQTFGLNRTLAAELEAEAAGILAWAVRGCLAWQESGLQVPTTVSDATGEFQVASDPLADFLDECVEVAADSETAASALFARYNSWADTVHLSPRDRLSQTLFGRSMTERFTKVKTSARIRYVGVRLRS